VPGLIAAYQQQGKRPVQQAAPAAQQAAAKAVAEKDKDPKAAAALR